MLCGDTENVDPASVFFKYVVPYGVKKMGFSEAYPAVYEKRIVGFPGVLRYCVRSGVSELVAWSYDEILK